MPELPEVETIKLQLEKFLKGKKIVSVEVKNRKIFQGDEKKALGTRILGTRRFGKVLCIDLSNKYSILAHLKLTGQFLYRGPELSSKGRLSEKVIGGIPGPHTHVIFSFEKGAKLYYNDVRRFGWIKITKSEEVITDNYIKKLGPEFFKDLTLNLFENILSKTSRAIKVVLMDQEKMGGVGNIYANDALWLAKINPKRPTKDLTNNEQKELFNSILTVLKNGLKYGGASELAFVTPDGKEGKYQEHTLVYGRQGNICPRCKRAKIVKFFMGGRGTYWCSNCQK